MVAIEEYLVLRKRPERLPAMHHKWRDLIFLHFSLDPDQVQALLPQGLTVDTFPDESGRERAWIGLVPFWMTDVRFHWLPPLPGIREFSETNVRTYVHRDGREPGVWFFSLDAANRLACYAARLVLGLPYHFADMEVVRESSAVRYRSRRLSQPATSAIECEVGERLCDSLPGSLEFFLIERYLLYAWRFGQLWTGQVHHKPYELYDATVGAWSEDLIPAAGISRGQWEHRVFSPGVDVEVFPFTRARG